jgi:hypothetical protein
VGSSFKVREATPGKKTAPSPKPEQRFAQVDTSEKSQVDRMPDGPRSGFSEQQGGRRLYSEEVPWPPAEQPKFPAKLRK